MNRRPFSVVVAALAIATPAFAGDSNIAPFTPREMAHCMMKRLRADNSQSFRNALKTCKEQFAAAQTNHSTETAMTVKLK